MIIFFYGPNTYASWKKLQEMVERFKNSTKNDFGLERFDGDDQNLNAEIVVSAITSVPFLAEHRLVIIENLLSNKTLADAVIHQLDRVPKETVVLFYEVKADERTSAFKQLVKVAKSKKFEQPSEAQLRAWVQRTVAEQGGKIEAAGIQYLVEQAGRDQWKLWQEINKLTTYSSNITKASIEQLVEPSFEKSVFDMVDALAKGNTKQAIEYYQGLRSQKEAPLKILAMIGWQLRNLLVVKAAGERSPGQIAKEAKMAPFVVTKTKSLARNLELPILAKCYRQLQQTDLKLKTTNADPDVAMEQLITDVARGLA